MNNLTIIAAIGKNNELGYKNDLIWKFKNDMKFFKENTKGKTIVMGRKTLDSIKKPLPDRNNIIITNQELYIPGVIIVHSKEQLYEVIKEYHKEIMIIGGSSIYKMFIDDANKLLLTEIDDIFPKADTYFPEFDKRNYHRKVLSKQKENNISFNHVEYTRK